MPRTTILIAMHCIQAPNTDPGHPFTKHANDHGISRFDNLSADTDAKSALKRRPRWKQLFHVSAV